SASSVLSIHDSQSAPYQILLTLSHQRRASVCRPSTLAAAFRSAASTANQLIQEDTMNTSPQSLAGKVALVTGASSGIGRAAAMELAKRGAKVLVSARSRPEIEALAAEIKKAGHEATAVAADINIEKDVINLVAKTISTYGRIDVAFNNAGTEGAFTPFVDQ